MDDEIETLLVDVRASTSGFKADMEGLRSNVDTTLVDGFARAGNVLERGLLTAIRRGSLGFDDLKRVAMRTLDEIAAQAVNSGMADIFGSARGGAGGIFGTLLKSIFDLPGRATGGPVAPDRPYWVGEKGPELFVPTAAGRVEPMAASPAATPHHQVAMPTAQPRDVRVSINLNSPRGTESPVALRRSSRQVASSVRRALAQY